MLRTGAALAAAALLGTALVAPASAATQDGTWWYTGMGVAEVHAQGATGAGVTVAVIDDGIFPEMSYLADADLQVHEPSFCADDSDTPIPAARPLEQAAWHGTTVTGFVVGNGRGADGGPSIAGVAPDARVLFYAVSDGRVLQDDDGYTCQQSLAEDAVDASEMARALRQAVDDGAQIITISVSGAYVYDFDVRAALAWALHEGVIVVAALGELKTGEVIPVSDDLARANGVVAVEACDAELQPMEAEPGSGAPMKHDRVTVCAPGVGMLVQGTDEGDTTTTRLSGGTSLAAPITAGALAAVWSAYPQATGHQMLQSLIRNTGAEEHDLDYDPVYGYGVVGLRHMLREDPTTFPDENPLLLDVGENAGGRSDPLTLREVAEATRPVWPGDPDAPTAAPEPSATTAPTAGAAPQDPDAGHGSGGGVPAAALVGGGAAVAALVVVAVLLARRRTPGAPTTTAP
ncbi:S8 family serine peptidase [Cellulomonas sp. NPDC057328]|uniref:S8 family peptidase n=1 Tax=Cellulomonas sp. NPDC057328 TaxID=3346101 RepID=UPI0036395EA8